MIMGIYSLAPADDFAIVFAADDQLIDELADGKTHGGLIAYVGERTFDDLPDTGHEHCLLAIIEGIEDPFNFGQIIRTLYAYKCG